MKMNKTIVLVLIAAALLLSACTGFTMASSWPGLSAQQDTVFVAFGGGVLAVKASDGSQVWRVPEKIDPAKPYFATPSFLNGQVLVGDYVNTLYSLDAATGAEKWNFAEAQGRYISGALVAGDLILAPSVDNNLYALNQQGRRMWKFTAQNDIWAAPVSDGKLVYVAAMDHNLYAVNLKDGTTVWSVGLGAAMLNAPALSDGVLYTTTMGSEVVAVEASGGAVVWRFATEGVLWASPVVKDGVVYVGDVAKKVYALDAKSGAELWKIEMPSAVYASAAVLPENLLVVTDGGDLVAVSFKGEKLWSQRINGKLYTAPVVSGEKVFVAVKDSEKLLFAYDFSGKEIWSVAVPK